MFKITLTLYSRTLLIVGGLLTIGIAAGTSWSLYTTYKTMHDELNQQLNRSAKIQAASLSESIWNLNRRSALVLLNSLGQDPNFYSASVKTETGTQFAEIIRNNKDDESAVTIQVPIFHPDPLNDRVIGTLEISLSRKKINQQLFQLFTQWLVHGLIQLTIVLAGTALALNYIFEPLNKIKQRLLGLAAGKIDKPIPAIERSDQLGDMARAVLAFRGALEEINHLRDKEAKQMSEIKQARDEAINAKDELIEMQSNLVQTAKLASVGELATGLAHELNQPLGIISLNAERMLISPSKIDEKAIHSSFNTILNQVNRATTIINHLRIFGRESNISAREPYNINTLINDSMIMLGEQFRLKGINIELNTEEDINPIYCNKIQIEQVLMNLLVNAKDALKNVSDKTICIQTKEVENKIKIIISDSGEGVPIKFKKKIFDPFFTTKDVGEGTGLGLSISYGIIKDHDGILREEGEPGKGAVFEIILPSYKGSLE